MWKICHHFVILVWHCILIQCSTFGGADVFQSIHGVEFIHEPDNNIYPYIIRMDMKDIYFYTVEFIKIFYMTYIFVCMESLFLASYYMYFGIPGESLFVLE